MMDIKVLLEHLLRNKLKELLFLLKDLINRDIDPFMTLSFLALPVIPDIKLTDKGLFDVKEFKFIDICNK